MIGRLLDTMASPVNVLFRALTPLLILPASCTSPSLIFPQSVFFLADLRVSLILLTAGMKVSMIMKLARIPTADRTPNCITSWIGDAIFDRNAKTVVKVARRRAIPTEPLIPLMASLIDLPFLISSRYLMVIWIP